MPRFAGKSFNTHGKTKYKDIMVPKYGVSSQKDDIHSPE
jgi:hypothetical protein